MAEGIHTTLELAGFPAAALKLTPETAYGGREVTRVELQLDQLLDYATANDLDEEAWATLGVEIGYVVRPDFTYNYEPNPDREGHGVLTIGGEVGGGLDYAFDAILSAARDVGLRYYGESDGRYEIAGIWRAWSPQWVPDDETRHGNGERTGATAGGHGPVLTREDYDRYIELTAGSNDPFGSLANEVRWHLNIRSIALGLFDPDSGEPAAPKAVPA